MEKNKNHYTKKKNKKGKKKKELVANHKLCIVTDKEYPASENLSLN